MASENIIYRHNKPPYFFFFFFFFNFRVILLRTDSYCPITKFTVKEKGKFILVFLRSPLNVKLGNFTR